MARKKMLEEPPKLCKVPTLRECINVAGNAMIWAGCCHEIALMINRKLKLDWQECYGTYFGYVHPESPFKQRAFTHHGWLLTPDGRVFDATRWVFTCSEPYIYCEINKTEYDLGGSRLNNIHRCPIPGADAHEKFFTFTPKCADAALFVSEIFDNYPKLNLLQVVYLANMSPDALGDHAESIYREVQRVGLSASIPLDYRVAVFEGGRY